MNHLLFMIFEAVILVTALSTDAFIASIAYGSNKIKIPFKSMLVIAFICTAILAISLFMGSILKPYISGEVLRVISFLILLLLGIIKLMDNMVKSIIRRYTVINTEIKFSLFSLNIILNIYANPKEADVDESKTLSPREAFSLAIALSIDSLVAGVGAALGNVNVLVTLLTSLILSLAAIKAGELTGKKVSEKSPALLSWLSGILLISLAFFKLLN